MQWWQIVLIVLAVLIVALIIFSFIEVRRSIVKLSPAEFKKNMRKAQLVDVRSRSEYEEGHINGARNINLATLAQNYSILRRDQPIYLYCDNGKLSRRAAAYLMARGYTEIYTLDKGLQSWPDPLKTKNKNRRKK